MNWTLNGAALLVGLCVVWFAAEVIKRLNEVKLQKGGSAVSWIGAIMLLLSLSLCWLVGMTIVMLVVQGFDYVAG